MFYCYEILKKRGKFGIIWLASTNQKLLTRRDLFSVDISRTCSDIQSYIHQAPLMQFSSSRLSLYLSAQLMYGVTMVCRKQHDFLFEDLRFLWEKLSLWRSVEVDVHILPPQRVNVTLDDSKLFNVGPDFGQMKEFTTSPPVISEYDYFVVLSPRSTTPEGSIPRPLPLPVEEHEELQYTVSREHITLPEMPLPEVSAEAIAEPDLPPFDLEDFEAPFPPQPLAPIPPAPCPPVTPAVTRDEMEGIVVPPEVPLVTPAAEIEVREPSRPRKPSAPPVGLDVTELPDVQAPVPERRPRGRALELNQFELEAIPRILPKQRRPRRRRLIVDDETQIPRDLIRQQLADAARNQEELAEERWFGNMGIPSLEPSVDTLFRRPGSRILSNVLKRPWKVVRTTAVPPDTAPPGSYCAGYEESPVVSPEELEEPPPKQPPPPEVSLSADVTGTQLEEMEFHEEVETPRVPELSGPVSRISLKEVTVTPEISMTRASEPSIQAELTLMMPIVEVAEPETLPEILEEPPRELLREKEPECMVSPERTPPPRSPEVIPPINPSLEKVINMIASTFSVSAFPEQIAFRELVPPQRHSRSFAANTFMRLLELHGRGDVSLLQPEESGDIFITKGENF